MSSVDQCSEARLAERMQPWRLRARWLEPALLVSSAACSLLLVAWVLRSCHRGFDFADEGFYLNWISNPFEYRSSVSQFGFIYHPIYVLVDGNIPRLRQVNVVTSFAAAWVLSYLSLKEIFGQRISSTVHRCVVSAAIATASLMFLRLWLPTPSYNWLAFQALELCATGLLLAGRSAGLGSLAGWVIVGIGGWLAFMAKPTTAVALAVCAAVYLIGSQKFAIRFVSLAVIVCLGLTAASAALIDGSVNAFIERIRGGMVLASMLGSGHSLGNIFRLDPLYLDSRTTAVLCLGTVGCSVIAGLFQSKSQLALLAGSALMILISSVIVAVSMQWWRGPVGLGDFGNLALWIIPLSAMVVRLALSWQRDVSPERTSETRSPPYGFALAFALLPIAFAFGTGNNYWWMAGLAGLFWALSGLTSLRQIAVSQTPTSILLPFCFSIQLIVSAQLSIGTEAPYYQPGPLPDTTHEIAIRNESSGLVVDKDFARYAADAMAVARHAGFQKGARMIDLTGHSPGLLYVIGATSPGLPWFIGKFPGYTGSDQVARTALASVGCESLAGAWLLVEPDGPVSLSDSILDGFGAHLDRDYENVGSFLTSEHVGGFKQVRQQHILKPIRAPTTALAACVKQRN